MKTLQPKQSQAMTLAKEVTQKLTDEDLALISGGRPKEDDEPVTD
ncbi:MAG: hypothetical protein AAF572_01525 [Cyanobacteria bacterium P01_B01_bin.77]